jgi:inhibitor of cysteine peptidase
MGMSGTRVHVEVAMRSGRGIGLVALLAVLGSGCATLPPVRVTAAQMKKPVTLDKGQDLYIALASNPTTGYQWSWHEPANSIVKLMEEPSYSATPTDGSVGKGGTQTFWFRATDEGSQKIRLLYKRPWEKGGRPVDVAVFEVKVR